MNGLSRVAGAPVAVEYPNPKTGQVETYLLGGMGLFEYACCEAEYLKGRKTAIDVAIPIIEKLAAKGLTAQANFLAEKAMEQERKESGDNGGKPSVREVQEWIDSMDGILFTCWTCLRQNHPDITMETTRGIVNLLGEEEMKRRRDRASGTDALGNEIGLPPSATPTAPAATVANDLGLGQESTGTSPKATVGDQKSSTA